MSPAVIQSLALFGAFVCCIALLYGIAWGALLGIAAVGRPRDDHFALSTIARFGRWLIGVCLGFLDVLLGPSTRHVSRLGRIVRWPMGWPFVRLALVYWVVGVTIAILFNPTGDDQAPTSHWEWENKASVWSLIAIHVWIWSSAIFDGISFNYSRHNMRRFLRRLPSLCAGDTRSLSLCRIYFLRDLLVASICLFLVLLVSNHTYYFALRADPDSQVSYYQVALNPQTVLADFASYKPNDDLTDVVVGTRIPGILLTALTCFVPTALWLGTAAAIVGIGYVVECHRLFGLGWSEAIRELGRVAAREHALGRSAQWGACLGLLFAAFLGLIQVLPIAFPTSGH